MNEYFKQNALLSIENTKLKRKIDVYEEEKKMYKKKLHNMNRVIERQKKTIRDLNSLITKLKDMRFLDQHALDLLNSVAAPNKEFLMRQLSTASDITSQKSYSADLREFALTLHFYSPAAYSYIRGTFQSSLPHQPTTSRWYSKIDAEPGFTTNL